MIDKPTAQASVQDNKAFLEKLNVSEEETSLSDFSSLDFEDALPVDKFPKRAKVAYEVEEEEEVAWEDAIQPDATIPTTSLEPAGDLEITLDKGGHQVGSLTNPHDKKKGPSKIERRIRISTHCMHVQFLLFHNLMRNAWVCDKEVQRILVDGLSDQMKEAVDAWKRDSGMVVDTRDKVGVTRSPQKGRRGKSKGSTSQANPRSQRDWGKPAERQEAGVPNMSRGDPIIRLLKYLAKYWRRRFRITAPSLRKQGYKSLAALETEVASFQNDKYNPEEHGEIVADLEAFRECARRCEGSRDVGAQLFTALIRGLGIEARLVVSLQPIGFGWNKSEEASAKKKKGSPKQETPDSKGARGAPIDLSEDDTDVEPAEEDDDSVIELPPSSKKQKSTKSFDKDMTFPTYWTEAVSPLTNEVYPVESLVLNPLVATGQEELVAFEPRGSQADKAKMVIAYVIAYSPDGTAKDVTTRYLKRHTWPGRTKGVRMPIEKIPVVNSRGKVKYYEEYDWFKTVISGYSRTAKMRTAVDDLEEAKDLKIVKAEKREAIEGKETLQGYKQSAEFVLERHLRREEAILPGAKSVKTFKVGKGENATEEPVFLRKDVMVCRTGESWHKEGRQVKPGERPMKMVPVRAVTLMRKREVEEAQRDSGEKLKQGLYSLDQTEWIIPPPIENGVIPKNAFGNMDCYVPTMVPKGAVHIPLKGTMKICKRLGIDYAEAVTGFEFGKQMAVPVITGVVVAAEHEDVVIDEWEKDEVERKIKEEGKREKMALAMWRKFLIGLRIVERVHEEYGDDADAHMKEEMNPFTNKNRKTKASTTNIAAHSSKANGHPTRDRYDEETAGGFLPDADEDAVAGAGFFQPGHPEEEFDLHEGGDFIIEGSVPQPDDPPRAIDNTDKVSSPSEILSDDSEVSNEADFSKRKMPTPQSISSNGRGKKKSTKLKATKPRDPGRAKQISTKPKTNGKKALLLHSDGESDAVASSKEASGSELSTPESLNTLPVPSKKTTRAAPKRSAARKSEAAVKSHYFEHGSDDDDGTPGLISARKKKTSQGAVAQTDGSEYAVDGKPQKSTRGRGRPRKTI